MREDHFRDIVEISPDAIAIQCEDLIVYINPAGAELFGYDTAAELTGKSLWDLVPPRYRMIIEKRCWQIREEGMSAPPIDIELLNSDGKPVDVELVVIPFTYQGKEAVQVAFHDISTRKWVEDLVRQRNVELSALNAIAATVSQSLDLNQILNNSLDDVMQLDMLGEDAQGMIFLRQDDSDTLSLVAHRGAPPNHPCLRDPPRIGECLCGLVVKNGELILSEDCHEDKRHMRTWPDMPEHKDVCLPLKIRGNVLGAMDVRLPASREIAENVVDLLSAVADQISVAIENARLFEEVSLQSERLRILGRRLAEAEEAERQRLALELHDQVSESLTALGINLNIIRTHLREDERQAVRAYIDDSETLVERTTERIRGVMSALRPPMLDDYGLVSTLRWYSEQFAGRVGLAVDVNGDEPQPRLPSSVESALFRISVEALTNVAKHAKANSVLISIDSNEEVCTLSIDDDGIGFDPNLRLEDHHDRGWGILTMSERAETIGGSLSIESETNGAGTRVIAEVPR